MVQKHHLEQGRFRDDQGKRQPVVPVRFVQSCSKGHVDDIDWRAFVHPDAEAPCTHPMWMVERGTSGTLADTWIVCSCGRERSMSQAARRQLRALGSCKGRRPWLGSASRESCGEPGRLLIRSASNAYFPQILSVISIPETGGELLTLIGKLWSKGLNIVASGVSLTIARGIPEIGAALQPHSDVQVADARRASHGGMARRHEGFGTAALEGAGGGGEAGQGMSRRWPRR